MISHFRILFWSLLGNCNTMLGPKRRNCLDMPCLQRNFTYPWQSTCQYMLVPATVELCQMSRLWTANPGSTRQIWYTPTVEKTAIVHKAYRKITYSPHNLGGWMKYFLTASSKCIPKPLHIFWYYHCEAIYRDSQPICLWTIWLKGIWLLHGLSSWGNSKGVVWLGIQYGILVCFWRLHMG